MNVKESTLWRNFSTYIRLRDANQSGYCKCISCGKRIHWKYEAECGHFMSRRFWNTKYNEKNNNAQCNYCNNKDYGLSGNQVGYIEGLEKKYGKGTSEQLKNLALMVGKKISQRLINELNEEYKEKIKQLKEEKGLE